MACLYKKKGEKTKKKQSVELENVIGCNLSVIPSSFKAPARPGGSVRGGGILRPEAVILFVRL